MPFPERWVELRRRLDPNRPAEASEYVEPPRSYARDVAEEINADPAGTPKFLLVGARGGGKSSELRAISRAVGPRHFVESIDLDRSGIGAPSVTALDLLYLQAVALLRGVRNEDQKQGDTLFAALKKAYGGAEARKLGTLADTLDGLAGFATVAGATAVAAGATAGLAPVVAGVATATAAGVRLTTDRREVPETSPQGQQIQEAAERIARAAQEAAGGRTPCVFVDGLEKMNGQAGERFRAIFEDTRLLAVTRWAAVYAAPPCTLTETNAADAAGWKARVVWGFPEGEVAALTSLLARRFDAAELVPGTHYAPEDLARIASASGGLPRHAVAIAQRAGELARRAGRQALLPADVVAAIDAKGEELALGLTEGRWQVLARVAQTARLPDSEHAASLFGDGRVIAQPPPPGSRAPRFVVHPLLRDEAERAAVDLLRGPP